MPEISDENGEFKILFFYQYLLQAQLIYYLFKSFFNKENKDIVFLINHTKIDGFQICQYKNGEIKLNITNFKGLDKSKNLEKNMEIIYEEIKKYENKRKVDILISESFDDEEKYFDFIKVNNLIKNKLKTNEEGEDNFCLNKLDDEFIKEVEKYSHIFYLD